MPDPNRKIGSMYCQLSGIRGFEEEKTRADAILRKQDSNMKVILILGIEGDWLYGQCNFHHNPDAQYDLKFIDTFDAIVGRTMDILCSNHNVSRLLFVDADLRERFNHTHVVNDLRLDLRLV
jgi:hypothetical protein